MTRSSPGSHDDNILAAASSLHGGQNASLLTALDALAHHRNAPMVDWLRTHLFEHVLPFWENHAIDDHGGLLTCLSDTGRIRSTDKWLWSQWRAVWVFSRIHNTLQPDQRWLRLARHIADFCVAHGWDNQHDGWALVLSREGKILRGHESVYVDAFAVYGLVELFRADRDDRWLKLACRTADAALRKLDLPTDRIPHFPYPIPAGTQPHGLPMIWSLKMAELAEVSRKDEYARAARTFSNAIFERFLSDQGLIAEYIRGDGRHLPSPLGTVVVPGHALECLWFQIHIQRLLGDGSQRTEQILALVLRHLEAGWDQTCHGGLSLAIDMRGSEFVPAWNHASAKLWWPHTEALYAALLGWQASQDRRFLQWYERLWCFCADHYVDRTHGEWRQKLDRRLQPLDDIVALPVKDPFHLPRSLILQIEALLPASPSKRLSI
jgi:N-acyl-D-glucosamine 2-epimerase